MVSWSNYFSGLDPLLSLLQSSHSSLRTAAGGWRHLLIPNPDSTCFGQTPKAFLISHALVTWVI